MSFLFSSGSSGSNFKMPEYTAVPESPKENSPEVKDASEKARKAAKAAISRGNTMLTGGMGVVEDAPVKRKTLLGR